jgi:hypothetical protein
LLKRIYEALPEYEVSLRQSSIPAKLTFSEIEAMDRDHNPLTPWRTSYDESDIAAFTSDKRILACIDAFQKSGLSYATVKNRILGEGATHGPRDLSLYAFFETVVEIGTRIKNGTVVVPPALEQEFPVAYEPEARTR